MKFWIIAGLACLAACRDDAAEPQSAEQLPSSDEEAEAPVTYPEPEVAGRAFRIEGIPTIDRTVFGTKRRYRNELNGETVQTGYYAVTPDNQLCFHFDDVAGNPCFSLHPDPDEDGAYILARVGRPAEARLIEDGPSDLDG
ncbi:hypothetical protein WJT74_06915 [Sphingomicrobium sp. XHP0239]|uniref:hypothetical protein n=1 Tax=Sphingomicrobium maritimum TaxID=3133972 RepID=UPI0031CC4764